MPRRNHHTDRRVRPYSALPHANAIPLSVRIAIGNPVLCMIALIVAIGGTVGEGMIASKQRK